MFKKALTLLIIIAMASGISLVTSRAMPSDYAAEQWKSIDDEFVTWNIVMQNGVYVLQSNKVYYEFVYVDEFYLSTGFMGEGFDNQVFILNNSGVSSSLKVFDQATDVYPMAEHYFSYESPEATEMFWLDNIYQEDVIQPDTFIQLSFVFEPSLSFTQRENIRVGMVEYYDMTFSGFVSEVPFLDVTYLPVDQLPDTEGNINVEGQVGYVSYRIVDDTVSLRIVYDHEAYYHQKTLSDVGFLQRENLAYYYIDELTGDPIVYLDYGSEAIPFLFDTSATSVKWRPFLLWNLRTNEIYSTDKVTVVSHIQTEDAHNVYSYFYMPYIDYDDVLQVQLEFDYRYVNDGFMVDLGLKEAYSNAFSKMMVLEKDAVTETTPGFVYNAYNFGRTAMILGGAMSFIAPLQSTGFMLFFGGIVSHVTANVIDEFELVTTLVDNIEGFVPTTEFRTFLQERYRYSTGIDDLTIDPTDQLHRLHLGQFQIPSGYEDVEIIPGSASFTHIIYQYQDRVIEIDRDYINDFHTYDPFHPFEPIPENPEDIVKWYQNPLVYVGVGLIIILIGIYAVMKGSDKHDHEYVRSISKHRRYY
jgi:hypothetical protein